MYLTVYLSSGLPLCRASLIHTIRPPAYTGFHVYVDHEIWASRIVGHPSGIQNGLGHGQARMYLAVYLSPRLPALSAFPYTVLWSRFGFC